MTDNKDWLDSLKVGDDVAVRSLGGFRSTSVGIHRVVKITATQVVVDGAYGEWRYRRTDGSRIGGQGRFVFLMPIEPVTQDVLDDVEVQRLRDWLDKINTSRASLDLRQLRALKAAYDATE